MMIKVYIRYKPSFFVCVSSTFFSLISPRCSFISSSCYFLPFWFFLPVIFLYTNIDSWLFLSLLLFAFMFICTMLFWIFLSQTLRFPSPIFAVFDDLASTIHTDFCNSYCPMAMTPIPIPIPISALAPIQTTLWQQLATNVLLSVGDICWLYRWLDFAIVFQRTTTIPTSKSVV